MYFSQETSLYITRLKLQGRDGCHQLSVYRYQHEPVFNLWLVENLEKFLSSS